MTVNPQVFPIGVIAAGDASGNVALVNTYGQLLVSDGSYPAGTSIVPYSAQLTGNGTTSINAVTSYISSIAITVSSAGTGSAIAIEDRQATPFLLVNNLATTSVSAGPTIYNFTRPMKMTGGIQIVTSGTSAATVNVFITYYQ